MIHNFIKILVLFLSISCIGLDQPIKFKPDSLSASKYKINIHKILGINKDEDVLPFHLFLYYLSTQSSIITSNESDILDSSIMESDYILSEAEDNQIRFDSLNAVISGDFEPEKRKVQASNLKNFQIYIESKEFKSAAELIGNPPNYEPGWSLLEVQNSYVNEIKNDIPLSSDELLLIYNRMINHQLYNMLDMYYKVEFDSQTIDESFLEDTISGLWDLRISLVDEIKRRKL